MASLSQSPARSEPGGMGLEGGSTAQAVGPLLYLSCNNADNTVAFPGRLKKKAETLYLNLSDLVARQGIERVAFMTLTFPDNVTDRVEAQRRFDSLARRLLRGGVGGEGVPVVQEYVAAVERQARGAIHYHLVVAFDEDIRSGFDFAAARRAWECRRAGDMVGSLRWQRVAWRSAPQSLRSWWGHLRRRAPGYGFGRCETLPVMSTAEAVGRYVGSYVSSEWRHRQSRDKGLRTIRYALAHRASSVHWTWVHGRAREWRLGCAVLAYVLGVEDLGVLGDRWSWHWRVVIGALGRHHVTAWAALDGADLGGDLEHRVSVASRLGASILAWEAGHGVQ